MAGRLGIIAGRGRLPEHVAAAARLAGHDPLIIPIKGESAQDWSAYEARPIAIADLKSAAGIFKAYNVDRVVLSGAIDRRPDWREGRPTWRSLRRIPDVVRGLVGAGDDRMLRIAISLIEAEGVKVISAHDIAPDLLAVVGPLGRHAPKEAAWRDIAAGQAAALALGDLDVGQGAVAVGGRVIALEGLEGTDAMLARVRDLRASGRLSRRHAGVLVKMCKPKQDPRADLPSIGPQTVHGAKAAGLGGIAVEAGRSLVLDREELVAAADAAGLFVIGIETPEPFAREDGR